MSISQISPNSLTTSSPYVNPYAKTTETQAEASQQVAKDAQKPAKTAQTDTVTISQQALQKTAAQDDSKPEEAKNAPADRTKSGFSTQV